MYLNWFFWGKKSIGRPTSRSHDWLIATSRWVNNPNRSCTQTTSVFTRLRNYRCQNQFITPFTHRVGGWVSQFADSRLARLPRTSFSYFTCHHYLWGKKEIVVNKQLIYYLVLYTWSRLFSLHTMLLLIIHSNSLYSDWDLSPYSLPFSMILKWFNIWQKIVKPPLSGP